MERYVQIGTVALRAPGGAFLPATPIYKAIPEETAQAAEEKATDAAAGLFFEQMKAARAAARRAKSK